MNVLHVAIAVVAIIGIAHLCTAAQMLAPSRVLLASGILYALPFVATTANLVTRYDNTVPVVRNLRYSAATSTVVLVVLIALVLNAVTDRTTRRTILPGFAKQLARRLALVYAAIFVVSAPTLLSLASTDKGSRLDQLPTTFVFLELAAIPLAGLAFGLGRQCGAVVIVAASFAVMLDLYLGYRVVFVLAAVSGALLRYAIGGRVAAVVVVVVVSGAFAGVVLKPVYYRVVAGEPVAVANIGTYVSEGVSSFESIVTGAVSQASIEDRSFYSLSSTLDLLPVVIPLSASLIGEPPSFAEAVKTTSFPTTPWGLGGSGIAELYLRDGFVGVLAGMTVLIGLSRWRPHSNRVATIWLLSCSFAMFYFWRSDLSLTLESTAKSVLILTLCCIGVPDVDEGPLASSAELAFHESMARDPEHGRAG